jgi:hypothetical protein
MYEFNSHLNSNRLSVRDRQSIRDYWQYISLSSAGTLTWEVESAAKLALEHDPRMELYNLAVIGLALMKKETHQPAPFQPRNDADLPVNRSSR